MTKPDVSLSRRELVLGGAAGFLLECQRSSRASPEPAKPAVAAGATGLTEATDRPARAGAGATRLLEWTFAGAVSTRTAMLVPGEGAPKGARFPVLIALHGRGEARKSPAEGALGWPRDYALTRAVDRVSAPPLVTADFEGFVDAARLAYLNRSLAERAYGGLIVACPYVPDLDLNDDQALAAFGRFVSDVLLPRVRTETPALPDASATGIDGVSLGGAVALAVGLDAPNAFGAVGTLQPAVDAHDIPRWTARALSARAGNPALALRLLTSDGDYFRDAVREMSSAWSAAGVKHDFELVIGPHDYPFNRGPGAIEMLLWHDRVLRPRA